MTFDNTAPTKTEDENIAEQIKKYITEHGVTKLPPGKAKGSNGLLDWSHRRKNSSFHLITG